jgi:hypothetical protein
MLGRNAQNTFQYVSEQAPAQQPKAEPELRD